MPARSCADRHLARIANGPVIGYQERELATMCRWSPAQATGWSHRAAEGAMVTGAGDTGWPQSN